MVPTKGASARRYLPGVRSPITTLGLTPKENVRDQGHGAPVPGELEVVVVGEKRSQFPSTFPRSKGQKEDSFLRHILDKGVS